jgi:hypothetical protein
MVGGRRRRSPNPGGSTPGLLMARRPSRIITAKPWVTSPYFSATYTCRSSDGFSVSASESSRAT